MSWVIQYVSDGAFDRASGYPVALAEATTYETIEEAEAAAKHLAEPTRIMAAGSNAIHERERTVRLALEAVARAAESVVRTQAQAGAASRAGGDVADRIIDAENALQALREARR